LDAFNEIESEVFQLSEHSDLIGLLGDINAKTGKLLDYVETDKSLLTIFDLQDDVDLINYMYDYENIVKAGASLSRNSNCTGRPNKNISDSISLNASKHEYFVFSGGI
jgi:hypothetical protein